MAEPDSCGRRARSGRTPSRPVILSVLVALTFAIVTPLAYASPPDQTWSGGFHDNADYDDVILAITDADGSADTGEPLVVRWVCVAPLRASVPPVDVASLTRLTLADRAPEDVKLDETVGIGNL